MQEYLLPSDKGDYEAITILKECKTFKRYFKIFIPDIYKYFPVTMIIISRTISINNDLSISIDGYKITLLILS